MFRSMKNRVEEDLERIKNANLPYYVEPKTESELEAIASEAIVPEAKPEKLHLEPLDVPAMIIAFFLTVIPIVAIFLGAMGVVVLAIYLLL